MHLHCMMKFYVERFPGSGTASTAVARYSVALQPPRVMAACCGDTVSRRSWLDRAERDTIVVLNSDSLVLSVDLEHPRKETTR